MLLRTTTSSSEPPNNLSGVMHAEDHLRHPRTQPQIHTIVWVVAAMLSFWIRAGFPVRALAWGVADDALFIRGAKYIATGHWLGPYDNPTLAKGMFYPLFIAATSLAAVPLKFAEQAIYLAAAAGVASYVGRQSGRRWLGTALFAALAFNPALWDHQLSRVVREGLYVSLGLGIVPLAVGTCFFGGCRIVRFALAATLGAVIGAFWLTREEGMWILPALVTVVFIALVAILIEPAPFLAAISACGHVGRVSRACRAGRWGGCGNGRYDKRPRLRRCGHDRVQVARVRSSIRRSRRHQAGPLAPLRRISARCALEGLCR